MSVPFASVELREDWAKFDAARKGIDAYRADAGSVTHRGKDPTGTDVRLRTEGTGARVVERKMPDGRWSGQRFTADEAGRRAAEAHFLAHVQGGAPAAAREMSGRLKLGEAADSLAKASTPEPFSTSRTSNWVARVGGLPDYIQHIAHDLVEKRGKTESEAIEMAIGIVKRWARGGGKVDAGTRAAAAKAVAEWEAKKAASKAKDVARVAEAADPIWLRSVSHPAVDDDRGRGEVGTPAALGDRPRRATVVRDDSMGIDAVVYEAEHHTHMDAHVVRRKADVEGDLHFEREKLKLYHRTGMTNRHKNVRDAKARIAELEAEHGRLKEQDTTGLAISQDRHRDGKWTNNRKKITGKGKNLEDTMTDLRALGHVGGAPRGPGPVVSIGSSPDAGGSSGWMFGATPDTFGAGLDMGMGPTTESAIDWEKAPGGKRYEAHVRGHHLRVVKQNTAAGGPRWKAYHKNPLGVERVVAKGDSFARVRGEAEAHMRSAGVLREAELTAERRQKLSKHDFAVPEKAPGSGSYPIHDLAHARNALARSAGKPEEARVRRAVQRRFPQLREGSTLPDVDALAFSTLSEASRPSKRLPIHPNEAHRRLGSAIDLMRKAKDATPSATRVHEASAGLHATIVRTHIPSHHPAVGHLGKAESAMDGGRHDEALTHLRAAKRALDTHRLPLSGGNPMSVREGALEEAAFSGIDHAALVHRIGGMRPGDHAVLHGVHVRRERLSSAWGSAASVPAFRVGGTRASLSHSGMHHKAESAREAAESVATFHERGKRIAGKQSVEQSDAAIKRHVKAIRRVKLKEDATPGEMLEQLLEGTGPRDYGADAWSGAAARAANLNQGETMRFPDGSAVKRHASPDGRDQWSAGQPSSWRDDGISWGTPQRTPEDAVQRAMETSAGTTDPESLGGSTAFYRGQTVAVNGVGMRFAGVSPTTGSPLVSNPGSPSFRPSEVDWSAIKPNIRTDDLRL